MQPTIVPIVEGHGEVEAVPLLFRKIAHAQRVYPKINPPARVKSASFLNDQTYFSKYVELAAEKAAQSGCGCVVILLDCEDHCPGVVGPDILSRAQAIRSDVVFLVFLAFREYETWFLTAVESLRGCSGLPDDVQAPQNPESLRDAKGWLNSRMTDGYDPVSHQAPLTERMDISIAQTNSSFRRLNDKLVGYLRPHQEQT